MHTDVRPPVWLSVIVATACVAALGNWPYGYYQLLRLVVTGYAVWIGLWSAARGGPLWPAMFGLVAVLYNPIFKISMSREVHAVENVCAAVLIVAELLRQRRHDRPTNA